MIELLSEEESDGSREEDRSILWVGAFDYKRQLRMLNHKIDRYDSTHYQFQADGYAQLLSTLPVKAKAERVNEKGKWVLLRPTSRFAVIGCFGLGYKTRVANGLLQKVGDLLLKLPEAHLMNEDEVRAQIYPDLSRLLEEYKDMAKIDGVTRAIELGRRIFESKPPESRRAAVNQRDSNKPQRKARQDELLQERFEMRPEDLKVETKCCTNTNRCICLLLSLVIVIGLILYISMRKEH